MVEIADDVIYVETSGKQNGYEEKEEKESKDTIGILDGEWMRVKLPNGKCRGLGRCIVHYDYPTTQYGVRRIICMVGRSGG